MNKKFKYILYLKLKLLNVYRFRPGFFQNRFKLYFTDAFCFVMERVGLIVSHNCFRETNALQISATFSNSSDRIRSTYIKGQFQFSQREQ